MTATATAISSNRSSRSLPAYQASAFPSEAALRLEQTPMWDLEKVFVRGATPDLDALVGWEFRGINHLPLNALPLAELVGIKKFVKGFHRTAEGKVMGYNLAAKINALDGRWHPKGNRYGFYEVDQVDSTSRDNAYLHAALLDYSKGDNALYNPMIVLRDYIVQVDAKNPDLYLGKAFAALGPLRIPLNFFILERYRVGLTDYAQR
jgi:hypothetical protein